MKNRNIIFLIIVFVISSFAFSCNKEQKQEQPQVNNTQQEQYVDKEKQLKEKEELLKIKEENLNAREQAIFKKEVELGMKTDSTITENKTDSSKIAEKEKKEKKIEKELNKKLDNPTETVNTYIEYLQRAISDPSKYDDNIKKANSLWQGDRLKLLQSSYKNTSKITIVNEPSIIVNKDNKASIRIKIKKTEKDNKESNMIVTYNLVADKNGKWKIKNNVIEK